MSYCKFLSANDSGALFVFVKCGDEDYCGYMLETEDDINGFLDAFGMTPADTNRLIDRDNVNPQVREDIAIKDFISGLTENFPDSFRMSEAARRISILVYNHDEYITAKPDEKLLEWTRTEYNLFRALEQSRYGEIIRQGSPQRMNLYVWYLRCSIGGRLAQERARASSYLCTLQPGISAQQLYEMAAENVQLIVPREYIQAYPPEKRAGLWTLKRFIDFTRELEGGNQTGTQTIHHTQRLSQPRSTITPARAQGLCSPHRDSNLQPL